MTASQGGPVDKAGRAPGLQTIAERERVLLAPYAVHSCDARGRGYAEAEHPYRGAFQRDRDRILHSAAYRRLSGKTQVFTDMGDYHRTRLTHTQEVASIARTMGRALRLNEDLIEALALFHDIGHPPYGHAGEDALNTCLAQHGGFSHNRHALTIVEELEHPYHDFPGLNLTGEVLSGQAARVEKRSTSDWPSLEVLVVDAADSITYNAHDTDDALELGLLDLSQLAAIPLIEQLLKRIGTRYAGIFEKGIFEKGIFEKGIFEKGIFEKGVFKTSHSQTGRSAELLRKALVHELIDVQVSDVLRVTGECLAAADFPSASAAQQARVAVGPGPELAHQKRELERFLYQHVYRHPQLLEVRARAQQRLRDLYCFLLDHSEQLPPAALRRAAQTGLHRSVGEYLASLTDRACDQAYQALEAGQPISSVKG